MPQRISYAQNGEDVRVWHAFGPTETRGEGSGLTYVEVGANEPRDMSFSAALYDLGWRGLLVEADPELAARLRAYRPGDTVINAAASDQQSELTFYRVPGTGLGTLDNQEAEVARTRGFEVVEASVLARTLDDVLDEFVQHSGVSEVHALSIDVEGAEQQVLAGLSLTRHRPWVMCIEAVEPGTNIPTHAAWESRLLERDYREAAFDGVNRWYVSAEHADDLISSVAGASVGMTISQAIAMPFNVLDIGQHGWHSHEAARLHETSNRAFNRSAWQRELILNDARQQVPTTEYERQIDELRTALVEVQGSRTYAMSWQAARAARKLLHVAQRSKSVLPNAAADRLVRERHLKHVTINMGHLTDPAFLGDAPTDTVDWVVTPGDDGHSVRPPLPAGLNLAALSTEEATAVREWIDQHPFDADAQLDSRMDNQDDEVGRVQSALRTRLRLRESIAPETGEATGDRIAFDARALQTPAFGTRGIGRFAKALLDGVRRCVGDERITLIVDRGLHPLAEDLLGNCRTAVRVDPVAACEFGALIQPSPMTHSPDPLVSLLHADIYKAAVAFDFIPMHFPTIYLRHAASRAEYAVNLDALSHFTEFFAISTLVANELTRMLARFGCSPVNSDVQVAWPKDVLDGDLLSSRVDAAGPIVLMTGDDARKNTFGGLAGIAAATSDDAERDVVVVGMAGQDTRVHHWSIAAAMRPGEARTLGRVSDNELADLLTGASCVVVPSFDEGLSLPVIEALRAGAPVVASDIPAHRELIGSGAFLCDPASPRSIAHAVRKVRGSARVSARQAQHLAEHRHAVLENAIAASIERRVSKRPHTSHSPELSRPAPEGRMSIGIATPWPPQRSGVADFSHAVFTELSALADVTIYATGDGSQQEQSGIVRRPISEVFDDPRGVQHRHDFFVSVVGNSHYHLLPVELLQQIDAVTIAHDTRMVEFYMALRGKGGAERVMAVLPEGVNRPSTSLSVEDQIEDMRLLSNAGLWEVANRSSELILHSPSAAPVITEQTGRPDQVLPFANYRAPETGAIMDEDRRQARGRLGLDRYPPDTIHLGTFGYVDLRTKMADVVLESAAWLAQWGYPVALHPVGSASPEQEAQLLEHATRAGLENFEITGYVTDEQYRDWVLAIDVGVQLRISPLLGVSGPLSDFAAYGTRAVASNGLCVDVDTPAFIHRLPDAVSPVIVAEAIEQVVKTPGDPQQRERERLAYLKEKSPRRYAELLLESLQERR